MRQSPVMRNPEDKGSLQALAAEVSQRLPDRQRDLLHQFLANAGDRLVSVGQPRDSAAMLGQNAVELLLQSMAPVAHVSGLANRGRSKPRTGTRSRTGFLRGPSCPWWFKAIPRRKPNSGLNSGL